MKVLLIDDEVFFQKFYGAKLLEAGYQVVTAVDGDEGLQKIREEKPDLILLDLIMPKKNGFEVLKALPEYTTKSTPVIIFSTLDQQTDIDEAKKLGATDYIYKSTSDWNSTLAKISSYMKH